MNSSRNIPPDSSQQSPGAADRDREVPTHGNDSSHHHHPHHPQHQYQQLPTLPPISSYQPNPAPHHHHPPPPPHHHHASQQQHGVNEQGQPPRAPMSYAYHQHQPPNPVLPPPPSSSYQHQLPQHNQQAPPPPPNHLLHHSVPPPHHAQTLPPYQLPSRRQSAAPLPPISQSNHRIPSPSHPTSRNDDAYRTPATDEPDLMPTSKVDEISGRRYSLHVAQQPVRARMCGFGDKDRRPITPPPCVRLVITDPRTGKELDISTLDHGMFVLNVDLWDANAGKEVNLVRSSQESTSGAYNQVVPSTPSRETSYPPSQQAPMGYAQDYPVSNTYSQHSSPYAPSGAFAPPNQYYPSHQTMPEIASHQAGIPPYASNAIISEPYGQEPNGVARMAMVGGQPHGMFTRNLIGSLAAGAFLLSDTSDNPGIWFVLQDLSVRTEGTFRLKFSFVDVSQRGHNLLRGEDNPNVNTNRAPILATAFTNKFQVFSAKRFPGVFESTDLSKTFATQGIKIPIRKDAKMGDGNDHDD